VNLRGYHLTEPGAATDALACFLRALELVAHARGVQPVRKGTEAVMLSEVLRGQASVLSRPAGVALGLDLPVM
jgi:hypothetical protein